MSESTVPQSTAPRSTVPTRTSLSAKTRIKLFLVTLVGLLVAMPLFAGSAQAAVYSSGGQIGPSSVGIASCRYVRTNVAGYLGITTPPPAIYARNYRAGGGNDYQLVRYRAFLVNANTGATVASTGYSGMAWAWDNSPATFNGMTQLNGAWNGHFVVDYRIEWLDTSGTRLLGWAAQRFNSYRYYHQGVGPYGPFSSCLKAY